MRSSSLVFLALVLLFLPQMAYSQFTQRGKASYYADKFQGRTTASGERYDANKFTCAHMSLPFGTVLEVENVSNGKRTLVRVNDRGPFAPGRIVDVSRAAARELDLLSVGTAEVKITVVPSSRLVETGRAGVAADSGGGSASTGEGSASDAGSDGGEAEGPVLSADVSSVVVPEVSPGLPPSVTGGGLSTASSGVAAKEEKAPISLYSLQVNTVAKGGFGVQVASYNTLANVLNHLAGMPVSEQRAMRLLIDEGVTPTGYKLVVGPFSTREEAEQQKVALGSRYPGCFIIAL